MITYSAAISACVKAKQPGKAVELLVEMGQKGLEPNVLAYNAAISAIESANQPDKAMELLAAMWWKGLEPDVITYYIPSVPECLGPRRDVTSTVISGWLVVCRP